MGQTITTKSVVPTSAQPIADLASSILERKGEKHRFVSQALVEAWPEIVGERLARCCIPTRMKPQRGPRSRANPTLAGDVLEVVADHTIAVDLEYGQHVLVERLNTYFGYTAVARLKIIRRALSSAQKAPTSDPIAKPGEADRRAADGVAKGVEDADLREALGSLGAHILAANRR